MGSWSDDFRAALRSLRRAPVHALTCTALLALGIASTIAVLAVGDSLLVRPLPVQRADRLIVPYATQGEGWILASAVEIEAWREAPSLAGVATARIEAVTLVGETEAVRLPAARVEADYLPLLGVAPVRGRSFTKDEARAGALVAVIGYNLWQQRLGGDPGVIGSHLHLEGADWEIIGVAPKGFDQPFEAALWRPLDLALLSKAERTSHSLAPIARLAAGRTIDQARSELAVLSKALETDYPGSNQGWSAGAMPLRQNLLSDGKGAFRTAAIVTAFGAFLLLLIALANVVQLGIVRATARRAELETRLSVGGSRASLARLLFFEQAILGVVAGLVSLPLSYALAALLLRLAPISADAFASSMLHVHYDHRVLAVVLLLVAVSGVAAGLVPALRAGNVDATGLLSQTRCTSPSRGQQRLFDLSVAAQVAVAIALLSATGALTESYSLLRGIDLGFRPDRVAVYEVSLAQDPYSDHQKRGDFAEQLVAGARGIDGVTQAGISTNLPLDSQTWISGYRCEGRNYGPGEDPITADRLVTPGYLEALGAQLISGRTIAESDRAGAVPVVVVNETLAKQCWPGQDAVGKRVRRESRRGLQGWMTIVGVVADVREERQVFRQPHEAWYLPLRQHDIFRDLKLITRSDGDPLAIAPQVRALVARIDRRQPVSTPRLLRESVDYVLGSDRLAALVMGYFTVVSLVLVLVGMYASMRRYVGQQHQAIGVFMALGATRRDVLSAILGRGLALALAGALFGMLAALALERLTQGLVYGALLDNTTRLALTTATILLLAGGACLGPALRAAKQDPSHLLRGQMGG